MARAGGSGHRQPGEEGAVGDGEIGVGHDGVGIDDLTVGEAHARDGAAGALPQEDAVDAGAVAERGAGPLSRGRQRHRQRVHAAFGDEDAVDGVHVGDDRVDREGFERRQPRVHRLEAEDTSQPLVVEVRPLPPWRAAGTPPRRTSSRAGRSGCAKSRGES